MTTLSSGAEDTFALGRRLALHLEKGSIVALKGPLGAGKTCFAKGIARGLDINEEVTSPTYTIISEYSGIIPQKIHDNWEKSPKKAESVPVYHIDAYRLGGDEDFSAMGGEEIVFGSGISMIEWSERIPLFIPPGAFIVEIEISGEKTRAINIYKKPDHKETGNAGL